MRRRGLKKHSLKQFLDYIDGNLNESWNAGALACEFLVYTNPKTALA